MKVNLIHIVEIAGGLVIGSLMSDAVNGIVNISKKAVDNIKKKGA